MDTEAVTLASHLSEATLVPAHTIQESLPPQVEELQGLIQLDFSSDNLTNTSIFDPSRTKLYTVKTTDISKAVTIVKKIVRRNGDGSEEEENLFHLEPYDLRSDKISIRGAPQVDFTSILFPSHILTRSRKFVFEGNEYKWTKINDDDGPVLVIEGDETPIARFRKSRPPPPPSTQARLAQPRPIRPTSMLVSNKVIGTPGLLDMVFITFLPMKKSRKKREQEKQDAKLELLMQILGYVF